MDSEPTWPNVSSSKKVVSVDTRLIVMDYTRQEKIEAVVKAPQLTSVSELRSFLGIVNYYSRFLTRLSSMLYPLYQLLVKGHSWNWTDECHRSFNYIKEMITSKEVLTHCDLELLLCLTTDALPYGLGVVLSHIMLDGNERPVAYASQLLCPVEKTYLQIEKEALAIMWGVKRFNTYVCGRHFQLVTDHQPLISILTTHLLQDCRDKHYS